MKNTNIKEQVADSNGAQIKENYTPINDLVVKDSNIEWAFQFNNEEPILFATTNGDTKKLTMNLADSNSFIVFTDYKGNAFKIFTRDSQIDTDNETVEFIKCTNGYVPLFK